MTADQTMQIILDIIGAKIDWTTPFAINPFFAGKGLATPAFLVIRPELDDRKGCRCAANTAQGTEMSAPGLPRKQDREQSRAKNYRQNKIGSANRRTVKSGNNLGPDDNRQQNNRGIHAIFL